jgi:hypothetical protein
LNKTHKNHNKVNVCKNHPVYYGSEKCDLNMNKIIQYFSSSSRNDSFVLVALGFLVDDGNLGHEGRIPI